MLPVPHPSPLLLAPPSHLVQAGCRHVIVTRGEKGLLWARATAGGVSFEEMEALPAKVISTRGAGEIVLHFSRPPSASASSLSPSCLCSSYYLLRHPRSPILFYLPPSLLPSPLHPSLPPSLSSLPLLSHFLPSLLPSLPPSLPNPSSLSPPLHITPESPSRRHRILPLPWCRRRVRRRHYLGPAAVPPRFDARRTDGASRALLRAESRSAHPWP